MPEPASPRPGRGLTLYLADGALLGLFMVSVGVFGSLFYAPASPLLAIIPGETTRRALMGLAMAATAIALIYSPWGGLSGAHMNPAVTLAYLRLGRITPRHAAGYITAQLALGLGGAVVAGLLIGAPFTGEPLRYARTVPGRWGVGAALLAEFAMAFVLMLTLLYVSNTQRLARYTPLFAGAMIFAYITIEAPVSGMSMNPARTLASAVPSGQFTALWVYFAAPVLGMLAAAEVFARVPRLPRVHCCKLNHLRPGLCPHCGCDGPIDFDAHRGNNDAAPAANTQDPRP